MIAREPVDDGPFDGQPLGLSLRSPRAIAALGAILAVLVLILVVAWRLGGWVGLVVSGIGLPILSFAVLEVALLALTVGADFARGELQGHCRWATRIVARCVVINTALLVAVFVAFGLGLMWTTWSQL